ncbi:hypothetical protein JCM8547_003960 [Rhodosporidiobolus lusitaniae]
MAPTVTVTALSSFQPGKAPLLLNVSPSGLNAFLRAAKLFFRTKKIEENEDKIAYLGEGLSPFPELYNWYSVSADVWEKKSYEEFTGELQRRALPRDFVWEAKGCIRSSKQGDKDFKDWIDDLHTLQLSLTDRIYPTRDFVEVLLYNMDAELSTVMRRGLSLKGTSFYEDNLSAISFGTAAPAVVVSVDYNKFDREARDEWSKISARRRSNSAQIRSLSKKAANLSLLLVTRPLRLYIPHSLESSYRIKRRRLVYRLPSQMPRQSHVNHLSPECNEWAPSYWVVRVPSGWKKGDPVPSSLSTTSNSAGIQAVHIGDDSDSEVDLPESFAYGSESDETDGLSNGSWSAGITTLLVAPLKEPFDIILGVPFLKQHRIVLVHHPEPSILVEQDKPLEPLNLLALTLEPANALETLTDSGDFQKTRIISQMAETVASQLVARVEGDASEQEEMKQRAGKLMTEFADLFPPSLPPISPATLQHTTTRHRIQLVDDKKRMLEEHLAAGRLRPSTSPYASAAFVVPKKDPTADPQWVNDYRSINSNTVKDRTPLPLPDIVLSDAARAKIWGKIDMTNAFFQMLMAEEDISKTAIKTPWGLFEWVVMPQGLCNAPASHQARVNEALRHLIGVCCEAFVDDIIIYSNALEEHEENCRAVLSALRKAGLFCSPKKTDLFTTHTEFLGHVISRQGVQADPSKTEKIKNWSRPSTVKQVRGFLGIVQYLCKFIPGLAEHTAVLTPLTRKGLTRVDHLWGGKEERAFEEIKRIVTSLRVLKPIDQDSDEPIWLMTDA